MANRNGPRAGGFIIAVSIMAGTLIGGFLNQPTIGLLTGFALGVLAALLVWWLDRG